MNKTDIITIATVIAAVYGTSEKKEAAQLRAAFIVAQQDIRKD